jgi:hypothetical protein
MNKPFEQELYDKYDLVAKVTLTEFFSSLGYNRLECGEMYKRGDVIFTKDGLCLLVETEVKNNWKNQTNWESCYDTIHIPYRKVESESDIHVMFNFNRTCLALISMKEVKRSNVIRINTRSGIINEPFFDVDSSKFDIYYKSNSDWIHRRKVDAC